MLEQGRSQGTREEGFEGEVYEYAMCKDQSMAILCWPLDLLAVLR